MTFRYPIDVRFRDIDRLDHVNNAVYLSYFEQTRIQFFRKVWQNNIAMDDESLILANMHIEFVKPVRMDHNIVVETYLSKMGTKSFVMNYKVLNLTEDSEEVMTTGYSVLVCYNFVDDHTIPIPEKLRKGMEPYFVEGEL